jgi:hypothetical protein
MKSKSPSAVYIARSRCLQAGLQISKIGLFSSAIFNAIEQTPTRENKHEIDVWSKICQTPVTRKDGH